MVHEQPAGAVNAMVPVVDELGSARLDGDSAAPTHRLADWVTVKLLPATFRTAERSTPPALAATLKDNVALPVPDEAMVIHDGAPVTVHAQADAAVTVTLLEPPALPMNRLDGEMVDAGLQVPAAWFTEKALFAIVNEALRATPPFAVTEYGSDVGPVPLDAMLTHAGAPATAQGHPSAMLTLTEEDPAAFVKDWFDGVSEAVAQGLPSCVTGNAVPPMLSVALRAAGPAFPATE